MAIKSKERERIERTLMEKGDELYFDSSLHRKLTRVIQDMNINARARRSVRRDQKLYSLFKRDEPEGKCRVVRNY